MTLEHALLIAILGTLTTAFLIPLVSPFLKKNIGLFTTLVPLSVTLILVTYVPIIAEQSSYIIEFPWVPSVNVNLSFIVDGISLFFGLIVSIMGAFVCFYAHHYLDEDVLEGGRFYSYLLLFMSAMLGTVFSNNIYLTFIFWEFTSNSSFFLIGFSYAKEKSQIGAQMALIVTGLTGLLLLTGFIILNGVTQTLYWSDMLSGNYTQITLILPMLFILLGAFGKSAQFPFHFWLPNAMGAPTPVSAYLHSAAMVKLGIFLVARTFPIFHSVELWTPILISVGFFTMLIGALLALFSHDIKSVLAYTTVSQLGYLIGYYGYGDLGIAHDFYQILNHVFYKGTLFMVAGIVIHSIGTKDIRHMSGLYKIMPLTSVACIIAALGMGGIPFTTGFISKELMLAYLIDIASHHGGFYWLPLITLIISATCLLAVGLRLILNIFFRQTPSVSHKVQIHKPSLAFQLSPFILSFGVLLFGLFPETLNMLLTSFRTEGLHAVHSHLHLFHGITIELYFSIAIILSGILLFLTLERLNWNWNISPLLLFENYYHKLLSTINRLSHYITVVLRIDRQVDYLLIILCFIAFTLGIVLYKLTGGQLLSIIPVNYLKSDVITPVQLIACILTALFSISVVMARRWTSRLIALSLTGLFIGFYFILYKAPDLALTQMLIEFVSLVLILLLLGRFPKTCEEEEQVPTPLLSKLAKGLESLTVGGTISV